MSIFLSLPNDKSLSNESLSDSFLLSNKGELILKSDNTHYQLLTNSRLSFIGCWLVMIPKQPRVAVLNQLSPKTTKNFKQSKQVFIFRDSINDTDFSRLASVLKQLASH